VIFSEKIREKYDMTITDQIVGLEIFAAQRNLDEYEQRFNEILRAEKYPVDQKVAEELGRTLMMFDSED
jgi:hypothetical protein